MSRYSDVFKAPADLNLFFGIRLPRQAPADTNEESIPGKLCWGKLGSLASGTLAPKNGFEVVNCNETHVETKRETVDRRIASEEDPDTSILVKRLTKLHVNKTENTVGEPPNTSATEPEGIGDFSPSPIEFSSFKPLGTENTKRCRYTLTLNPNEERQI